MSLPLAKNYFTLMQTRTVPRKSPSFRRYLPGLLLISPWLIGALLFKFAPIIASFTFSFTDFMMVSPDDIDFVGLKNYGQMLTDRNTYTALFGTIGFAGISIPVQMTAALLLALLFKHEKVFGRKIYRALIFLPSIVPGAAIFAVWTGFLDPGTGWLNQLILLPLGFPPYPGPNSEAGYNFYIILAALWSIGPAFIIMLSAMESVDKHLYEAARVDGAGPFYRFLHITIPIISPAIFFSLIISVVSVFGGAVLMDRSTTFQAGQSPFDALIFRQMFEFGRLGAASAYAWVLFMGVMLLVIWLFRSAVHWVHYPDGEGA